MICWCIYIFMSDRDECKGKFGVGGHPKQFSYTYGDIAKVVGIKVETVRRHVSDLEFDPGDFASVVRYIMGKVGSIDGLGGD